MRLATLRRPRPPAHSVGAGSARLDRRTKTLIRRLQPGDVAIIDHLDLDRVAAEELVRAKVSAVVNAVPSISGRYPNLGPEILVHAGVPLLDDVGAGVFTVLHDGQRVELDGNRLMLAGKREGKEPTQVATGTRQTAETIAAAMSAARVGLAVQLEAFAANTMEYLRRERNYLLDAVTVPELRTKLAGRHALIVVRGYDYAEDLASLRPYIREYRPILVAVDGGADALREAGYVPDLIVGDCDSVSDEALRCGAEIVVHAYPDGSAPGLGRVEALGLAAVTFPAAGTSEDLAMILADELGAELIVAVGSHATLMEFLDKGRSGMASTFLTRLRVGGKLVDAKGVSRLYRSRIKTSSLVLLVVCALLTFAVAIGASETGRTYLDLVGDKWNGFTFWLGKLVH